MFRATGLMILCVATGLSVGCGDQDPRLSSGSDSGGPAALTDAGATILPVDVDLPADGVAGEDQDSGTTADAHANDDGAPDVGRSPPEKTGLPLPDSVPPPRHLVDQVAQLSASGQGNCTHQVPPSDNGDRWCAFTRPTSDVRLDELWVINVSRAAAGEIPPCDGTSPDCLLLSSTVDIRSTNAFDGDTMIFHSDSVADPLDAFVGPISAWRPGWTAPRQISSARGIACRGHALSNAAMCLVRPGHAPDSAVEGELLLGRLNEQTGGALASVGAGGAFPIARETAWQGGFAPNGDTFAISQLDPTGTAHTLYVIATTDGGVALPREVIRDIRFWTISGDGRKIYFARSDDVGSTLLVADFPDGTAGMALATGVTSYLLVGSPAEAVAVLSQSPDGATSFRLVPDRDRPDGALTIFEHRGPLQGVLVSPDLRYTVWLNALFQAEVVRHDDLTRCQLNSREQTRAFFPAFVSASPPSQSSGLLFWTEPSAEDEGRRDAYVAPPDRCRDRRLFARSIDFYTPIGARGLIFSDELEESGTLKYAALKGDGPAGLAIVPVRIQERVKPPVVVVGDQLLLFRVTGDGQQAGGLYLFGPLPF